MITHSVDVLNVCVVIVLWCSVVRCGGVRCVMCVVCCFVCAVQCVYIHNAHGVYAQKASMCAAKTPVCHVTHGRFDGTPGGVFECTQGSVSGGRPLCASLSLSLLLFSALSVSVLDDDDNEHSSRWLSLYTRL